MTASVLPRRAPAMTPRACASAISLCFIAAAPALAQDAPRSQTLAPVVVTGARFTSDPAMLPIGATVITADEIRRAGAGSVGEAINKIGGVFGRKSLTGSSDYVFDMRGFGSNSSNNMVVVVDGVRMSENELSEAALSTIQIDSVERIEITRGGSSVLYGDGATGGVINIVTKHPGKQGGRGTVYAEVGQLGQRELRASATQSWNGFSLDAGIGAQRSDNYRDNNKFEQNNYHIGAQWALQNGRVGVRLDRANQDYRLAGGLSLAEFHATPRKTNSPNDFASYDSDRLTAFIERRIGAFDLAAELSHREKTAKSTYYGSRGPSNSVYESKQTQFSPRLRHLGQFGDLLNEVVAGIDLIRWNRTTSWMDDSSQKSQAIYLRDEIKFDGPHRARVAAGVRHETFDKDSFTRGQFARTNYDLKQSLNAWDLQGSYDVVPLVNLHAKVGQSYRIATSDENGSTSTGAPLLPQKSRDLELGATVGDSAHSLTARLFRHRLTNEIYYDPTLVPPYGANTNLAPTRREGIEIEGKAQLAANWRLSGHLQHVKATFSEGAHAGKTMVLVPKNTVSTRLSWLPNDGQSADVGVQWVDSQRYGGDFSNTCSGQIPSFTTVDARYARKLGAWEFALSGKNLSDKKYFSNAYACNGGIYPSDGRQLKVSARYDF